MHRLLERRNFRYLTVNDLCKEAQVSRATFYAHYRDKYDLLRCWMASLPLHPIRPDSSYHEVERNFNTFFQGNARVITNMLEDADGETLEAVESFLSDMLCLSEKPFVDGVPNMRFAMLFAFCSGGIIRILNWQVRHKFPPETQVINPTSYAVLMELLRWKA